MGACSGKSPARKPGVEPARRNLPTNTRDVEVPVREVPQPPVIVDRGAVAARDAAEVLDLLPFVTPLHRVCLRGTTVETTQESFGDKGVACIGEPTLVGTGSSIGFACKKGLKPESPNQDDLCIYLTDKARILGVFDGHGPYGHDLSNFVQQHLPKVCLKDPSFKTSPLKALEAAFPTVHRLLVDAQVDSHFDCGLSGCSAALVLQLGEVLHLGHVGDTRVVIARDRNGGGKFQAEDLTCEHKPSVEIERRRILAAGGQVRRLEGDIPHRVFLQGKTYPGLSMSRSLGDTVGVQVGVISEPEVQSVAIKEDWRFLLLCSDGIWEFLTSQEAVDLVAKFPAMEAHQAAAALASEAWARWIREEGNVVDDITVIVWWFTGSAAHPATGAG